MSRSLRELKVCFLAALALLCLFRLWERIETLVIQPITVQQRLFGHVVAYPWKIRSVDMTFGDDGVAKYWRFAQPGFPAPVTKCVPDPARPHLASPAYRGCQIDPGANGPGATWDQGVLTISLPPERPAR